jgi:murein DD-endopeptidase MepM/ murein hydrolase activator NlpD
MLFLAILTAALCLVAGKLVAAAPPAPVVTTPTPVPTPTLSPAELRRAWLLTPAAERQGGFLFLPLVMQDGGAEDGSTHADPGRFTYVVQADDTLWSLALDFGRDLEAMSCTTTPTGSDAETLAPGRTITVPALEDLCYTVTPGDTLAGIAARHGVAVADIVAIPWNGFSRPPYSVRPRQRVLVPGARAEATLRPDHRAGGAPSDIWSVTQYKDWPYGDGKFVWPVTGWISQRAHAGHVALDIAVPYGTPVKAVDRGKVIMAGWNPTGYGFRVVIDHGIDYVTLYAHLSDIYIKAGDVVGKGQVIGASGANGNITGPHLHFEIRDFGRLTDPLPLLPR